MQTEGEFPQTCFASLRQDRERQGPSWISSLWMFIADVGVNVGDIIVRCNRDSVYKAVYARFAYCTKKKRVEFRSGRSYEFDENSAFWNRVDIVHDPLPRDIADLKKEGEWRLNDDLSVPPDFWRYRIGYDYNQALRRELLYHPDPRAQCFLSFDAESRGEMQITIVSAKILGQTINTRAIQIRPESFPMWTPLFADARRYAHMAMMARLFYEKVFVARKLTDLTITTSFTRFVEIQDDLSKACVIPMNANVAVRLTENGIQVFY